MINKFVWYIIYELIINRRVNWLIITNEKNERLRNGNFWPI